MAASDIATSSSRRPRPAPSPGAAELLREAVPVTAPGVERTGPAQGMPSYARELLADAVAVQPPADDADDDSPWAEDLTRPNGLLKALWNVLFVVALIAALFTVTQAVFLFNQIALLPAPARPAAYTVLGLFAIVLVYCGLKFTWRYARLRVSPTLNMQLEQDLQRLDRARQELRAQHAAGARRTLADLLAEYPVERSRDIRELRLVGFSRVEVETVTGARFHLAGRNAPDDDSQWLQMYEADFLAVLDAVADRQVRQYYTRVLGLTAASPRGGLDTLIVLWCSYQMVFDLCRIYNVRAGRWGTVVILAHLLVNVLAARGIHNAADSAAGTLGNVAHQHLGQATAAAAGVAAKLLGRVAEGGVNCLLMWRLSLLARDYLRPIRRSGAKAADALPPEASVA